MKAKTIMILLLAAAVVLGGLRFNAYLNRDLVDSVMTPMPVEVIVIEETTMDKKLTYEGRISPESLEKVSFKSSGRLAYMDGEIGDQLAKDHPLVALEDSDLQLAYEAAGKQLTAAEANYQQALKGAREEDVSMAAIGVEKAEEAVIYLKDRVSEVTTLFEEGVTSESELEGIRLELSMAEKDLNLARQNLTKAVSGAEPEVIKAAKAQRDLAEVNLKVQQSLIDDSVYTLKSPMVLVDKLYEAGELVPSGYPVAVLRSLEQEVMIGVTAKDLSKIALGGDVVVTTRNKTSTGQVKRISEVPDDTHFLYEVAVALGEAEMTIGDIGRCEFILGQSQVIAVPITAVMNDGIDYVYVAENNRAVVRQLKVLEVTGGNAIVEGLTVGDHVIVSNLNRLQPQSLITEEVKP